MTRGERITLHHNAIPRTLRPRLRQGSFSLRSALRLYRMAYESSTFM